MLIRYIYKEGPTTLSDNLIFNWPSFDHRHGIKLFIPHCDFFFKFLL